MTTREEADIALGTIQSRLEAYEAHVGNDGMSPEMLAAIDTLNTFIQQYEDDNDLEWGEPGDCLERINNDPDIAAAIETKVGEPWAAYVEQVTAAGLGRHYGDPHCIWCLQGM